METMTGQATETHRFLFYKDYNQGSWWRSPPEFPGAYATAQAALDANAVACDPEAFAGGADVVGDETDVAAMIFDHGDYIARVIEFRVFVEDDEYLAIPVGSTWSDHDGFCLCVEQEDSEHDSLEDFADSLHVKSVAGSQRGYYLSA